MYKIECICGEGTNDYEWIASWFIGGVCDSCGENIGHHVYPDGTLWEKNHFNLFICECGQKLDEYLNGKPEFIVRLMDVPQHVRCECDRLYQVYDWKVIELKSTTEVFNEGFSPEDAYKLIKKLMDRFGWTCPLRVNFNKNELEKWYLSFRRIHEILVEINREYPQIY